MPLPSRPRPSRRPAARPSASEGSTCRSSH
jgi:hypothetical protein